MVKPETTLCNQTKNLNIFIQGIEVIKGPMVLGGVQFFLKDIKQMAIDMELVAQYVALDVESLRRENKNLRGLMNNG